MTDDLQTAIDTTLLAIREGEDLPDSESDMSIIFGALVERMTGSHHLGAERAKSINKKMTPAARKKAANNKRSTGQIASWKRRRRVAALAFQAKAEKAKARKAAKVKAKTNGTLVNA